MSSTKKQPWKKGQLLGARCRDKESRLCRKEGQPSRQHWPGADCSFLVRNVCALLAPDIYKTSISRLRPPFPGRVSAAASPELRGVATGGGGRSGFVQNLGTWKKRQPPHPHLHPAEAFPERLGDAVGRRERLDRWVRGAGVRRARVYLGAA
uniref:Uncharacterized protein n=1 Tax=Rangifer tarandus platyrhynchus TaxID=3082113 RepID=A0ACB0FKL4_RANTA|nr:unnamed protein product [Rangifer tarandus platyrhynchus]